MSWAEVAEHLPQAHSIAFDGCHKIYILLDADQTAQMSAIGYRENVEGGSWLLRTDELANESATLSTLQQWFDASCPLRFVSSVRTVAEDPNKGFRDLIRQGEDVGD